MREHSPRQGSAARTFCVLLALRRTASQLSWGTTASTIVARSRTAFWAYVVAASATSTRDDEAEDCVPVVAEDEETPDGSITLSKSASMRNRMLRRALRDVCKDKARVRLGFCYARSSSLGKIRL